MQMSPRKGDNPKVVSRKEWLVARKQLLAKEKQLTRQRDAIAAERRQLPWVKVEKNYVFDSPSGKTTLADLFDGGSQLIVYHFMLARNGRRAAPVAPSTWITRTAHLCIWRNATSPLPLCPGRRFPKSKPLRKEWAGSSHGFRPTKPSSTMTSRPHSLRSNWPKAKSNTTTISCNSPVRKRPASASSTRTKMATSSTPIPRTLAAARTRSTRTT